MTDTTTITTHTEYNKRVKDGVAFFMKYEPTYEQDRFVSVQSQVESIARDVVELYFEYEASKDETEYFNEHPDVLADRTVEMSKILFDSLWEYHDEYLDTPDDLEEKEEIYCEASLVDMMYEQGNEFKFEGGFSIKRTRY